MTISPEYKKIENIVNNIGVHLKMAVLNNARRNK